MWTLTRLHVLSVSVMYDSRIFQNFQNSLHCLLRIPSTLKMIKRLVFRMTPTSSSLLECCQVTPGEVQDFRVKLATPISSYQDTVRQFTRYETNVSGRIYLFRNLITQPLAHSPIRNVFVKNLTKNSILATGQN